MLFSLFLVYNLIISWIGHSFLSNGILFYCPITFCVSFYFRFRNCVDFHLTFFFSLLLFATVSIAFHRSIDVLLWLCLCVLWFKPKIWPHTNSFSISFSLLCIITWLECNLLALIEFNTYSRKLAYVWDLTETMIRGNVATWQHHLYGCVCVISNSWNHSLWDMWWYDCTRQKPPNHIH